MIWSFKAVPPTDLHLYSAITFNALPSNSRFNVLNFMLNNFHADWIQDLVHVQWWQLSTVHTDPIQIRTQTWHIHCTCNLLVQDAADSSKNCPTGQTQVLSSFSPTTHSPPGHCMEQVSTAEGEMCKQLTYKDVGTLQWSNTYYIWPYRKLLHTAKLLILHMHNLLYKYVVKSNELVKHWIIMTSIQGLLCEVWDFRLSPLWTPAHRQHIHHTVH